MNPLHTVGTTPPPLAHDEVSEPLPTFHDAFTPELLAHLSQVASRELGVHGARWATPDDLAQDCALEAIEALAKGEIRSKADLTGFAVRRIHWRVLDSVRKHRHEKGESHVAGKQDVAGSNLSSTLNRRELASDLERRICELPSLDGEVVRRVALKGESYGEVAKALDSTAEAIRKRYRRAVERMGIAPTNPQENPPT